MPSSTPPPTSTASGTPREAAACGRRNFWAWVGYQFFYRIGWQFKMESTMMAGLISYLSPSPGVMGLFTALNGLGRNLSPLVAAPIVDRFGHKRGALLLFWGATVVTWSSLTVYLWLPVASDRSVTLWVFGIYYTAFFTLLGAANVAQGALLGKIIPAAMRGRAMAAGMTLSGVINVGAILLIYGVLRRGGFPEPRNYALAFTLTSSFFTLAGVSLLFIREEPSPARRQRLGLGGNLRHFAKLARENRNLSRLMGVNLCVSVLGSMLQFYTGYWRHAGSVTPASLPAALMMATVLQVFWQSLSSSILGRVADRHGNRTLICRLLWIEAGIPLVALVLGGWEPFRSQWLWYLGVYCLVGLRFPLYQLLVNYLLEIVPQEEHAMALGAVTTVQLLTAPAPVVLGAAAGLWGYGATFVLGSLVGAAGALAARGLEEVRGR